MNKVLYYDKHMKEKDHDDDDDEEHSVYIIEPREEEEEKPSYVLIWDKYKYMQYKHTYTVHSTDYTHLVFACYHSMVCVSVCMFYFTLYYIIVYGTLKP